jgi:acyl-CoA synthetase (AMP-forming)/AMP-acid ligase II/pimeloyl-ACP methyl ester carboxylesterase
LSGQRRGSGDSKDHVHPLSSAVESSSGDTTKSIYECVVALARLRPEAKAVLEPGRVPLTFAGLLDRMDAVRIALNEHGLGRGDRVGLLAERGLDTASMALGIAGCAVCIPLNPEAFSEVEESLKQTRAKALLVPATMSSPFRDIALRAGVLLLKYSNDDGGQIRKFYIEGDDRQPAARGGPAASNEVAFIMRTSGTTARAKIVPLSHQTIIAQAAKLRRLFDLSSADICLNAMPLCYAHGLITATIMSIVEGGAVIEPPTGEIETLVACMQEFSPTWYTATPPVHQAILSWLEKKPGALSGHRLRFARSGSGALPMRVAEAVENILGMPLLESYASTEAGVMSCNPVSGRRKLGTVGTSPYNDLGIMDENGTILIPEIPGQIVVRGSTVFDGYEDNASANEIAFHNGWFRTGDSGLIDRDGYLKVLGRVDDVINRGGEKISPHEIDEALLAHEMVKEAAAFPVPHPTLNQEIVAAVVLRAGAEVTGADLRHFLRARIAAFKIPRRVLCVSELPKGPTGKVLRNQLAMQFATISDTASDKSTSISSKTQDILLALWRSTLKRQDIGLDDDFFLSGGDSLTAIDLVHRIENELQYVLPITVLVDAPTARQLAARLEIQGADENTARIHGEGTRRPLFAIEGLFGDAFRLLPLMRSLGADQPCYCLQPPGMDWTNAGCNTLPEMAAHYVGKIKEIQPQGPYRLFGTSFGGLVVFEMALQLQRSGEVVEFLGMVDTAAMSFAINGNPQVRLSRYSEMLLPQRDSAPISAHSRVGRAHLRASMDYVLDNQAPQTIFRGELTYLYCTGNAISPEGDGRQSWRFFAEKIRVLGVSGLHGEYHHEPLLTDLQTILRACLQGAPPPGETPAHVFDRVFHLQKYGEIEKIVSSTGETYVVQVGDVQGRLETVWPTGRFQFIRFEGWAVGTDRRPAQAIAVFLDEKFLGYGASGISRQDLVKCLSDPHVEFCGFQFDFPRAGVGHFRLVRLFLLAAIGKKRLRLFVLSSDGCASELRHSKPIKRVLACAWRDGTRALTKVNIFRFRRKEVVRA